MTKVPRRFRQLLYPNKEVNPWLGVVFEGLLAIIFGAWTFIPLYFILFAPPDPNAYPCAGPGPVDFGCTGGTDAIIANTIGTIFGLIVFVIFLIAVTRLINRVRYVYRKK